LDKVEKNFIKKVNLYNTSKFDKEDKWNNIYNIKV
jgi:hypothetical protein